MTPIHFATLLIRAFSALMFVLSVAALTEIAYGLFSVLYSTTSQTEPQRVFLLAMYVARFLIYFCSGTALLIFTKPLAKLFTKDLG
jgi:hypothetical protein